jgi:hypothetical protein
MSELTISPAIQPDCPLVVSDAFSLGILTTSQTTVHLLLATQTIPFTPTIHTCTCPLSRFTNHLFVLVPNLGFLTLIVATRKGRLSSTFHQAGNINSLLTCQSLLNGLPHHPKLFKMGRCIPRRECKRERNQACDPGPPRTRSNSQSSS